MSLMIASINSGSNGNCYYVGNENEAVFIDAGISCRETEIRMKRLGLDLKKIKAVFISHEHSDHIKGLTVLSKKYQIPVYITEATHRHARIQLEKNLIRRFTEDIPVQIGELSIAAFQKFHDAGDPHSFTVSSPKVKVGIFTDIGQPCKKLIHHFKQCHAAFLESNYDEDMLLNGNYPYYLKKRISGGSGHLSNKEAVSLFTGHCPVFMHLLILAHLSENNNTPGIVKNLFDKQAKKTKIIIASRNEESPLFKVHAGFSVLKRKTKNKKDRSQQLVLF